MASFKYTRIPTNPAEPLELRSAPTAGGLEVDELKKAIREHFKVAHSGGSATDGDIAAGRMADVRSAVANVPGGVPEDLLASAATAGRDVDIMLLSAPVQPDCLSVALYTDPDAGYKGLRVNARATALAIAAGHAEGTVVRGDAFLARTRDDEKADVWERVDLAPEEAVPGAAWLLAARALNASRGSLETFSTGGALAAAASAASAGAAATTEPWTGPLAPPPAPAPPPTTGVSYASTQWASTDGGRHTWRSASWGQEIEVKVPIPKGTKAKALTVIMTAHKLGVSLKGSPEVGGALAVPGGVTLHQRIDLEESSWQVEEDGGETWVAFVLQRPEALKGSPVWTRLYKADE